MFLSIAQKSWKKIPKNREKKKIISRFSLVVARPSGAYLLASIGNDA
jgi:hypothetical protein